MTQPPYPPPPPAAASPRPRPSVAWFVLGGVLLVLALVVFVGALVLTLRPLLQADAVFAADGSVTRITLPAHEERAVFFAGGESAACRMIDGSGQPIRLRGVNGTFTSGDWTARYRFDSGDGHLLVRCVSSGPDTSVLIGPIPTVVQLAVGIGLAIGLPLVLGLAGVVVLVVTTIRWSAARR